MNPSFSNDMWGDKSHTDDISPLHKAQEEHEQILYTLEQELWVYAMRR